jgi:hypothetical protein
MAANTKTIKTNVTLHVPDKGHEPFKYDINGAVVSGKYVVKRIPPGTPVTLDADEADAILETHGGEVVTAKGAESAA